MGTIEDWSRNTVPQLSSLNNAYIDKIKDDIQKSGIDWSTSSSGSLQVQGLLTAVKNSQIGLFDINI